MNDKIKELVIQAGGSPNYRAFRGHFLPPPPDYIDPATVDLAKFAELIVRECIERVRNQYIPTRDKMIRTEREEGIVSCGVNSVIALEELIQEQTDKWYKENILGVEE